MKLLSEIWKKLIPQLRYTRCVYPDDISLKLTVFFLNFPKTPALSIIHYFTSSFYTDKNRNLFFYRFCLLWKLGLLG